MTHFWETMQFGTVDYLALPLAVLMLTALALAFDFTNGIHDAANSIANVVSTGVLSPGAVVVWAAFFNFVAFAIFHLKVAGTMGKGLIEPSLVDIQWSPPPCSPPSGGTCSPGTSACRRAPRTP